MKRVTLSDLTEISDHEVLTLDAPGYYSSVKYYGVVTYDRDAVAFIMSDKYRLGPFEVICARHLTIHNGYNYSLPTLRKLIESLIKGSWYVMEFETSAEFFDWMAKATASLPTYHDKVPMSLLDPSDIPEVLSADDRKITHEL